MNPFAYTTHQKDADILLLQSRGCWVVVLDDGIVSFTGEDAERLAREHAAANGGTFHPSNPAIQGA